MVALLGLILCLAMVLNLIQLALVPAATAFLNRLRGTTAASKMLPEEGKPTTMNKLKDVLPKAAIYCIMALISAGMVLATTGGDWKVAGMILAACAAGNFLGYSLGWGKYYPFSPKNTSQEKEIGFIDAITNKLVGKYTPESTEAFGKKWRTVAMCLRFGILFAPKYIACAIILKSLLPLIVLVAIFGVGVVYRIAGETKRAEIATGLYIGFAEVWIF